MERFIEIDGREIPLLEPPHGDNDTPRRILYVLFKHKLFIAAVFFVVSLPIILYVLLQPKEYIATSKVLIKPGRAFLNISPTSGESSFRVFPSPEVINSEIQIIKSRELLQRLDKELPYPSGNGADKKGNTVGRLKATPIRLSNLIQISLQGSNPEWLARVVNRAAELYLEQTVKVHKTQGVEEFYDEQEKKLQMELIKAEMVLKEYQEKEKIVDAGPELSSSLTRVAAFETNLKTTESSIRETNERIRILEAQLKEQPENVSASKQVTVNPVYDQIRHKLTQLELERDSLLQRYTPNDRLVIDKGTEIVELKERLAKEQEKVVGSEAVSLNTIRQGILNSLLAARAEFNALEARRSSLLRQLAAYSSGAAELKRKSFTYDRLQQEVNTKKESLALYKKRAEEARISDAMDERKFSNAYLFEKATPPLPRAGFGPLLIIPAILLMSTGVAVGAAFAIEFLSTTLRSEADVEEKIGLPVLATIQHYGVVDT
jgi:uncharacterized protein involved in exopolysaccharide biosynthesis